MSIERILEYPDSQMVVVQSRYGYGWFAGIELECFPVISTANDNNGEFEVDYYGQLGAVDPWFPYATGNTPKDAVQALEEKLKELSPDDLRDIGLALNILRGNGKMPTYGLKVVPGTLKDLKDWIYRWNHSELRNEDFFIKK